MEGVDDFTMQDRADADRGQDAGPVRRLTIEMPDALSEHIALCCAKRGAQMADVLRQILEREFPRDQTA